ncbi:BofC C-terminal domain-containing protein [Shouchella miscanthi]|uniref:BofC C-terminal domain-containing protein n=1 Tax=Shouchella miscanthi TaxID=2598861 RepID=A0ABU6NR44_9BACI|nr:BofC C-terminal domain-containing protein [Shouchella miscanthi]
MYKKIIHKHWIPFVLGAFSVILFYSTLIIWNENEPTEISRPDAVSEQADNEVELLFETVFADGISQEETRKEAIYSLQDFWYEYSNWQVVDQKKGFVHFKQELLDLSPEVKQNGYLGLSDDNRLILYTGQPEAKKIIQTYDQLERYPLTPSVQLALAEGMKVSTVAELVAIVGQDAQ